jgi:hypothetical protein
MAVLLLAWLAAVFAGLIVFIALPIEPLAPRDCDAPAPPCSAASSRIRSTHFGCAARCATVTPPLPHAPPRPAVSAAHTLAVPRAVARWAAARRGPPPH